MSCNQTVEIFGQRPKKIVRTRMLPAAVDILDRTKQVFETPWPRAMIQGKMQQWINEGASLIDVTGFDWVCAIYRGHLVTVFSQVVMDVMSTTKSSVSTHPESANSHPSIAMNSDREEELARWAKMLRECPESSSHTHVTWITDGERYVEYRTGRNKKEWQATSWDNGQYVWVPETEYQPCRSCRGRLTTQQVKDAEQYEYRQRPDVRIAMLKAQIEIAELEARLKATKK